MSNLVAVCLVALVASIVGVRQDVVDVVDIDMELDANKIEHAAEKKTTLMAECSDNDECSMLVGAVGPENVCYEGAMCSQCPACAQEGDDNCPECKLSLCDVPEEEYPQCKGGYKRPHEDRCNACKAWGDLEESFALNQGLKLKDVDHGGNCMYHAIDTNLQRFGGHNTSKVRQDIAKALMTAQLRSHAVTKMRKFAAQIARDYEATYSRPMDLPPSKEQFQEYLDYYILPDRTWGNEIAVLGASLAYGGTWHLVECYEFGNTDDSFGTGYPYYYIMAKNQHFFAAVPNTGTEIFDEVNPRHGDESPDAPQYWEGEGDQTQTGHGAGGPNSPSGPSGPSGPRDPNGPSGPRVLAPGENRG